MKKFLSPKWLILGILLCLAACVIQPPVPTGNSDRGSTKASVEPPTLDIVSSKVFTEAPPPYPTPTDGKASQLRSTPTDGETFQLRSTPTIPNPTFDKEAKERYAYRVLEPYFANLPFRDQALTSPGIYGEYFGCVENNDVGGVLTYYVKQNVDTTLEHFDQYLAQLPMETDEWEKVENSGSTVEAVTLYAKHPPDEGLPLLLSIKVSVANLSNASDPKYDPELSLIWIEVTAIENTADYEDRENKAEVLFNHCPDRKFWLSINHNLYKP